MVVLSDLDKISPGPACTGEAGIKTGCSASRRLVPSEMPVVKAKARIMIQKMLTGMDIFLLAE